jgi:hypothetical protein
MMRMLIRAALEDTGMEVLEANSYEEALRLGTQADGIAVVIVPTGATGLREKYTMELRRNRAVRCLTLSVSRQHVDLFELRLVGADVGRKGVVEAIQIALAGIVPMSP